VNNYRVCKKEVNNINKYEKRKYTTNTLEETEKYHQMNSMPLEKDVRNK